MKFIHYYDYRMYFLYGMPFFSFWELRYLFGINKDSFYYMKDKYGIYEASYGDVDEDLLWKNCAPGIVEDLVTGKIYKTTEEYLGCTDIPRAKMVTMIPSNAFLFNQTTRGEYLESVNLAAIRKRVQDIKDATFHKKKSKYTLEDFAFLLDVCDRNGGILRAESGFHY